MRRGSFFADLQATEALREGDACEFRFPARSEWLPGVVVHNGGHGWWAVRMTKAAEGHEPGYVVLGLYLEHVRALGTDPWEN